MSMQRFTKRIAGAVSTSMGLLPTEITEETLLDDKALAGIIEEQVKVRLEVYMRANQIRHARLIIHGTDGAGDSIIPWATIKDIPKP